ncbi:MAG: hypothetical protein Q4D62_07180 [Planctomycetia bacterium]|nr:hypothetical protein [Planctomycetia bacterium]
MKWWMSVAAVTILGCFSPLWGADSVVAVATVTDGAALTRQVLDFAEVSGSDKIKAGAYGWKVFTEQPCFTEAIDMSRPAGVVAWLPEGERSPRGFWILPVKSGKALQKMLPGNWQVECTEDGLTKITVKKGETFQRVFYAAEYDSWLILAEQPSHFPVHWTSRQIDEAKRNFEELAQSRDLGVTLYVNRLPVEIRREVFTRWNQGIRKCLEKNRSKWGEELSASLLEKMDRLMQKAEASHYSSPVETLSWNLIWEENADMLKMRLEATAAAGSSLGEKWNAFAKPVSTVLGKFGSSEEMFSSQVSMKLSFLASPEVQLLAERYGEQWLRKMRAQTVSPEVAETVEKFVRENADSWKKAFLAPNWEEAFQIVLSRENLLVMWGRAVPDSAVLEKQFQQIVNFVKEQETDALREKVVESGKEVEGEWRIYYADFALPENSTCPHLPWLRSVCGTSIQGCVVFAPQTVYYAIGKNAKADLLAFLKSDAARPTAVPALRWNLSLRQLLEWTALHGHHKHARFQAENALKKMGEVGDGAVSVELVPVENGLGIEMLWTPSAIRMLKGI